MPQRVDEADKLAVREELHPKDKIQAILLVRFLIVISRLHHVGLELGTCQTETLSCLVRGERKKTSPEKQVTLAS
jgi:hypothetical protein